MAKAPHEIEAEGAQSEGRQTSGIIGRSFSAVISALALVFSGYSLWDSSLKAPDLKIFVPPVIQFSAP
jgi:hypothetical protein